MILREDGRIVGLGIIFLQLSDVRKGVSIGVDSLYGVYFSIVARMMMCPTCDNILRAELCAKEDKLCKSG